MTKIRIKQATGIFVGIFLVAMLSVGTVVALDNNEIAVGDVYLNKLYVDDAFPEFNISEQRTGWTNVETGAPIAFVKEVDDDRYYIADSATSATESTIPGIYRKAIGSNIYLINVKYPTATVTGIVYDRSPSEGGVAIANLIGGIAYTDKYVIISTPMSIDGDGDVYGIAFTNPDATLTRVLTDSSNNTFSGYLEEFDLGVWTLTPVFQKNGNFSKLAPTWMYGEPVTFTLINGDFTKTIAASPESVTQGGYVTITLTAPYGEYYVGVDGNAVIPSGQYGVSVIENRATVHVGMSGEASFIIQSVTRNDLKVSLYENNGYDIRKQIVVAVNPGTITATPEKESIYIGDEFEISGTNDLGGTVYFYIKGTNYPLTLYLDEVGSGKVWDATIDTAKLNRPDAGVYTIYVAKPTNSWYNSGLYEYTCSTDDFDNTSRFDAYTTISVSLIQPYISVNVPATVVQGDKLVVTGTAEGSPRCVKLYVFGTNFFATDDASVLDDGTYSYSKKIIATDKEDANAWKMATGQYFLVVQHPMYDKTYNIGPIPADGLTDAEAAATGDYNIVLNESGSYDGEEDGTVLFNTLSRQSANAAQALIDAIGSQNIDDMQAHQSFIVSGPTSYVNAVPSQVVKGQILTVSGTTTGHVNEMVSVELLSTAFAAVPKETVESTAFATLTTRIGDDGVWSVSFDTSNLNADDYTVSIAVGSLDPVTARTKIVAEAGPEIEIPINKTNSTLDASNNYYVNPTGALASGTKVTASMTITYRDGAVLPTQLNLDSDLVGVSWTVVKNPGAANAMTFHPVYPYDYISNFDLYESSGSVVLRITVNGTVSSTSAGNSIVPLTISESGGTGRVFIAPSQYVFDVCTIPTYLEILNTSITALESAISFYEGYGFDCSVAQKYLDAARINYTVASAAGTDNPLVAYSNYERGMTNIDLAGQSLSSVGLGMILSYTTQIDDGVVSLYAKGWNVEAKLIDTKNTGIKNSYAVYLRQYQSGNANFGKILTLSQTAVEVYDEMTGYLLELEVTASANLSTGWNFISVPKKLSADYDTAAELFADVNMANHALLSYNAQTKSWEQLTGSSVISPLDAIWIYSASPVTLLYEFSTTPGTPAVKKVYEGWNAVGVSADSAITAQAAFGNTDWYTYLCWNSAKQKFYTPIIKGSSGNYADTNLVYPWSGGWLYVNADGNYVGFTA